MYISRKRIIAIIITLALVLPFCANVGGVSLSPQVVEKLRREGRLEEWVQRDMEARTRGVNAPNPNPPVRLAPLGKAELDTLRPLVICVDFSDNVATHDTSEFSFILFTKNYVLSTGSFRDYYLENSYNTLDPNGAVYGWVRAPQTYAYYVDGQNGTGTYPKNTQGLVEDILNAIDPYVDFQEFDYNNDLELDGLIVIHAGPGAEETGSDDDIWSHEWGMLTTQYHDGVRMREYTINPERHPGGGLIEIGVFCHEFGHFLGAYDLYDYGYDSEGAGDWSVMASGSWLNGSRTPCHFDPYHKYKILGFAPVTWIQTNQTNFEIPQVETNPVIVRLMENGAPTWKSEYFLVENRQRVGFDTYIPGEGLLIWHIDQNAGGSHPNDNQWCPGDSPTLHYRAAIEQADGDWELEGCPGYDNQGDNADPFPGSTNKRAFDDTTTPSSRGYPDTTTQVAVWNISDSGPVMYANLDVLWSRPCAILDNITISDAIGGDGDGRPEPGETVRIYLTISNIWLGMTGVSVTASADTDGIIFTNPTSNLGDLPSGASANNNTNPIVFEVAPGFPGRPTQFTLFLEGDGGAYTRDFHKEVWAGLAQFLIVDAAGGYQSNYTAHLDSMKQIYDIWEAYSKIDPDFSFQNYKYIIWYTGDYKMSLFSQAQVDSLISFFDGGGRLFLTSQDAVEVLAGSGNPSYQQLLTDYLHLGYDGNNTDILAANQPGDEIGDNMWIYPGGPDSPDNQTSKDNLIPDAEADTVLRYAASYWDLTGNIAATKFQNDFYKVVVFGFGFEGMNTSGSVYWGQQISTPYYVMQTVMEWLIAPGPTINLAYPNGGESWFVDSAYCIEWESIAFTDSVKIEYSIDAGATWSTIAETTTNNGEYCWITPDSPSDSCLIAISDIGNGIPTDTSEGFFRIINYLPGDATGNLVVDVSDAVFLLNYLFKGGPVPNPKASGDVNQDCVVDVADAVYVLNYLFKGGNPPKPGCA